MVNMAKTEFWKLKPQSVEQKTYFLDTYKDKNGLPGIKPDCV